MDDIDRSRRRVLRTCAQATALLAGSTLATDGVGTATAASTATSGADAQTTGSAADAVELSVATQNLGLGADFLAIARPDGDATIPERVGDLYAAVRATEPRARMRALADALARERPDVLALQEAALVRRGPRSGNAPADPDAGTVAYDFLGTLREALAERGVPYRPAAIAANADLEFPARLDGGAVDLRLTDRDAVLVRADADVEATGTTYGAFEASLTLPLGGDRTVEVDRGFAGATLRVGDEPVDVVSTHLEAGLESVRVAQARELAAALDAHDAPLVVAGDLNDGPAGGSAGPETGTAEGGDGTATAPGGTNDDPGGYGILTASLSDPVGDGLGGAGGTCCRPASLAPPDGDGLPRRIDHVLVDGLGGTAARRLGVEPFGPDGERRWVSDHAGVLVELSSAASATSQTASATPTARTATRSAATPTNGTASQGGEAETATPTPGFGVASAAAALLALGAGAASALRDRDDERNGR